MTDRKSNYKDYALPVLAVFLLTVLVFLPSLRLDFVWEDRLNLLDNTGWRGFSPGWWFTSFVAGDFKPLVWATYSLEYSLWGLAPAGYHLTSVLLHGLNAALVFLLVKRLAGAGGIWAAAAALFFSLHPLRVEAVSWITARKEVLFAFFYLGAILAYLKAAERREILRFAQDDPYGRNLLRARDGRAGSSDRNAATGSDSRDGGTGKRFSERLQLFWFLLSIALAYLSFLSKPMAVSLPAILLLLDWHQGRFVRKRFGFLVLEKVPYAVGAAGVAAAAFYGQIIRGALAVVSRLPVINRVYLAARGIIFYLEKTFLPLRLQPVYPIPDTTPIPITRLIIYTLIVILITIASYSMAKRGRKILLFCWGWYIAAWLPVSGIFQTGLTVWADRFSYLPAIALSFLAAWAGDRYLKKPYGVICAVGALAVFSGLAIRRQGFWRDDLTLWERFGESESYVVHFNLGNAYLRSGRNREAADSYRRGVRLRPEHAEGHQNLGLALSNLGEHRQAERHFRLALGLDPESARAWSHLGGALFEMGRKREAEEAVGRAVALEPGRPEFRVNLANVLAARGEYADAAEHYRAAIELAPASVSAYYNLAVTLEAEGRPAEAEQVYRRALALDPGHRSARYNLALLLLRGEDFAAARDQLEELDRRHPGDEGVKRLKDRLGH